METRNLRKVRQGVVVSNKMDKTIVIASKFKEKHPIYGKFVQKTKKYHAHDDKNEANVGDTVQIMETRPLSKTKRRRLVQTVEKATLYQVEEGLFIEFENPQAASAEGQFAAWYDGEELLGSGVIS